MKIPKIMVVCGFGLGTSLVLKMTLDDVLQKNRIDADTFCSDADTAIGQSYDLVLTSKEMREIFEEETKPIIFIQNFLSFDEVQTKAIPVIQKMVDE
jgi:PTS system ascorbate-specific IIB component